MAPARPRRRHPFGPVAPARPRRRPGPAAAASHAQRPAELRVGPRAAPLVGVRRQTARPAPAPRSRVLRAPAAAAPRWSRSPSQPPAPLTLVRGPLAISRAPPTRPGAKRLASPPLLVTLRNQLAGNLDRDPHRRCHRAATAQRLRRMQRLRCMQRLRRMQRRPRLPQRLIRVGGYFVRKYSYVHEPSQLSPRENLEESRENLCSGESRPSRL